MKKIILPALFIIAFINAYTQTLFTYGSKAVSKTEFVKAFDKNPSADTAGREKLLRSYLDLYIRYKLKVQAAYNEKLNETDEYKSEADNFKKQLAETAINNEANINSLVREAFIRSRKDIQLAQIFIPVAKKGDTATVLAKINEAYNLLKKGKSFDDVVTQFAQDSISGNAKGNIGFITVFTLPYEAENLVYALHPGGYAKPFKSRIGYHIFKETSERPAMGIRKVQHILFATSPGASDKEKKSVKTFADSVYQLIQNGASFADMQALYGTKKADGRNIIEVSVGEYSPDFEREVFALQKEGDVAKPFETAYGFNIIKLVEKQKAFPDTGDIAVNALMQEKVSADDRLTVAKQHLSSKWKMAAGYKPAVYSKSELWQFTDSAMAEENASLRVKTISYNTVLFSFTKKKILVEDWIRYVQMMTQESNAKPDYERLMSEFISYCVTDYYRQHIGDFHPELTDQLQEFNDANLLFAAMDKHVWSKASADTSGMLKYYNTHKQNYNWAPGADAIIVTADNKKIAGEIEKKIMATPANWRSIADSYGSLVQADSSRFENNQLPVKDTTNMTAKAFAESVQQTGNDMYSFVYITKIDKLPEPRSFEDARGMIINDYQQVMEDKWIAEIKKKYPVKVNEAVFNSIK